MKVPFLFRQAVLAAVSGIGLALGLTLPARSLTADEAAKVSAVLADLSGDLGPFAYDEEEAGRIFEEDAAWKGRITAAGFSRESWQRALDETFRGYLATIPTDVFSARLTAALDSIRGISHLTDEQKAELLPMFEEKIAEIQLLRAEGAAFADAARPHAAQIEAVFKAGLVPSK